MPKRQSGNKKGKQSNFAKLSIFQPNKYKFKKTCPLSVKGAPEVDYKNIKLLKKYISENGKILLFNADTGALNDDADAGGRVVTAPQLAAGMMFVLDNSGTLTAFD